MRSTLVEYDQYGWKPGTGGGRGGVSLLNLPQPTTVDMTRDVFWPWYAGSLFGHTAAAGCVWACVMRGRRWSVAVGEFYQVKKKNN